MSLNLTSQVLEYDCLKIGLEVVRHPLVRFAQMCATLTCSLGLFFLSRMLIYKLPKYVYHSNIKILLWFFHFTALVHSVVMTYSQIHQFIRGFVTIEPCSIFLDPVYYSINNIAIIFILQYQIWLLVGMWIERLAATIFRKNYETQMMFLGPALVIAMMFVPTVLTYWAYKDETWEAKALNVINTPSSSGSNINIIFYVHLGICVLCFFLITAINRINNRIKLFNTHVSLNRQYQLSENVTTTKILMYLSIFTSILYMLYLICTLAVRLCKETVFFRDRYPLFQGVRNTSYVLPLFDLMLPLVTQFVYDNAQRINTNKRLEVLAEQATGEDGWRVYSSYLHKHWA